MLRLINPIRRYDWGSTSAIPDILGVPPDGDPQAELWMGAHPDSPSTLPDGRRLDDAVAADAQALLGASVRAAFGDRLPYLAKILAAAAPLSLQVHPAADQAAAGFAEEEARGVPSDARVRRYRDPFHKPEMVVALGDFDALCGWRDPVISRALLADAAIDHPLVGALDGRLSHDDPAAALRDAVGWLLGGPEDVAGLVQALGRAADARADVPELVTAAELARLHPGDPGVVVAMLLNRVTLAAGEALYLPAGNVHAYLRGTAVEVMAASDNVLRAGLTTKHIDAPELLRTVDWTPRPLPYVAPSVAGVWRRYRPGATEFEVSIADLGPSLTPEGGVPADGAWAEGPGHGPRIVLALGGSVAVRTRLGEEVLTPGHSLLVPGSEGPLHVRGVGTAVVIGVPSA